MDLARLRPNLTHRERCPYCHDSLGEYERVECESCGTPHHPVCLEELGGCTVLGCDAIPPKIAMGPVEELRARVRRRVDRYREGLTLPQIDDEAVRQRMADQPPFCVACERELLTSDCPVCKGELLRECGGDSVHCTRPDCNGFYAKIARMRGAPIQRPDPLKQPSRRLISVLLGLLLLLLSMVSVLVFMVGGSASAPFVTIAALVGAALVLFGPLILMMVAANKRIE